MKLANMGGYLAALFLGILGLVILYKILTNQIDLTYLISEPNGDASMSRFQLLVFTFVIAIALFRMIEENPGKGFPDIPQGVLTLLGISASTYAVGKGIQFSRPGSATAKVEGGDGGGAETSVDSGKGGAAVITADTAKVKTPTTVQEVKTEQKTES